jgi:translation initiation factor 2 subunit 2
MDFNTMLDDIYTLIEKKDNNLFVIPEPLLEKTSSIKWTNYNIFLNIVKKPNEHVFQFIKNITGKKITMTSVEDGLIIHDKRITSENIINVMKKYVEKYVMCNSCKKTNTDMIRDNILKLHKIKCSDCLSEYTV